MNLKNISLWLILLATGGSIMSMTQKRTPTNNAKPTATPATGSRYSLPKITMPATVKRFGQSISNSYVGQKVGAGYNAFTSSLSKRIAQPTKNFVQFVTPSRFKKPAQTTSTRPAAGTTPDSSSAGSATPAIQVTPLTPPAKTPKPTNISIRNAQKTSQDFQAEVKAAEKINTQTGLVVDGNKQNPVKKAFEDNILEKEADLLRAQETNPSEVPVAQERLRIAERAYAQHTNPSQRTNTSSTTPAGSATPPPPPTTVQGTTSTQRPIQRSQAQPPKNNSRIVGSSVTVSSSNSALGILLRDQQNPTQPTTTQTTRKTPVQMTTLDPEVLAAQRRLRTEQEAQRRRDREARAAERRRAQTPGTNNANNNYAQQVALGIL